MLTGPPPKFHGTRDILPDGSCTAYAGVMALFSDGVPMIHERPQADCAWTGDGPLLADYRVGTWSSGAREPTLWPGTRTLLTSGAPRQVGRAATSGNWAVWEETESTDLVVDNWRVFTHDRSTGETHLIGRSEDLTGEGRNLTSFYPSFTIAGDRAYWSTAPAEDLEGEAPAAPEVVSAPVGGNQPLRVETTNADEPVATGAGVVVRRAQAVAHLVQQTVASASVETSAWPVSLVLLSDGGQRTILTLTSSRPLPAKIDALAAMGDVISFAVGDSALVYNMATNELTGFRGVGPAVTVPADSQGSDAHREVTMVNATAVTSNTVAWTFGGGSASDTAPLYIYDLRNGRLSRVDVPQSFGELWLANDTIGWRSANAEGTVIARLTADSADG